jgi:hypothetical protein
LDWTHPGTPSRLRLDLEGPTGAWHLLATFNWAEKLAQITVSLRDFFLPKEQVYLFREIWSGECGLVTDGTLKFHQVPAHGAIIVALRPLRSGAPSYVGSDLHISQGMEVIGWKPGSTMLKVSLLRPGKSAGNVYLHLPQPPRLARLNNDLLTWQVFKETEQIYAFPLRFDKEALLEIQ